MYCILKAVRAVVPIFFSAETTENNEGTLRKKSINFLLLSSEIETLCD